jgi:hypothetical protein
VECKYLGEVVGDGDDGVTLLDAGLEVGHPHRAALAEVGGAWLPGGAPHLARFLAEDASPSRLARGAAGTRLDGRVAQLRPVPVDVACSRRRAVLQQVVLPNRLLRLFIWRNCNEINMKLLAKSAARGKKISVLN